MLREGMELYPPPFHSLYAFKYITAKTLKNICFYVGLPRVHGEIRTHASSFADPILHRAMNLKKPHKVRLDQRRMGCVGRQERVEAKDSFLGRCSYG